MVEMVFKEGIKMNYSEIVSHVLMIIASLVIVVNIVTEVVKNVFELKNAKTINIFVTIFSVILTVLCMIAYVQLEAIVLTWYMAVAFIIIGFMVAYAAMFGYDKLLSYFEKVK